MLKIHRAINILSSGSGGKTLGGDVNLKMVAMALAGYSSEQPVTLWREMCASLGKQLSHPYLKAMFAFITSDHRDSKHTYSDILVSVDCCAPFYTNILIVGFCLHCFVVVYFYLFVAER